MTLAGTATGEISDENRAVLDEMIERLGGEMRAMHDVHPIGFSVYEAILGYLDNKDAPDCLTIDSLFYEKLTRDSYAKYLSLLTELVVRAKECGDLERSPFRGIGKFDYSEKWRVAGESVLRIYERELKTLRFYARELTKTLNMRTASLTPEKTAGMYRLVRSGEKHARPRQRGFAAAFRGGHSSVALGARKTARKGFLVEVGRIPVVRVRREEGNRRFAKGKGRSAHSEALRRFHAL